MRIGKWYAIFLCKNCESRITYSEKMYNCGVCPKCGKASDSTSVRTHKIVVRQIKHHQWWQFWKRKYSYEGADKQSKEWLSNQG